MRTKCARCPGVSAPGKSLCKRCLASRHYTPPPLARPPRKRTKTRKPYPLENDDRWRDISRAWLAAHPWCVRCERRPLHVGGPLRKVAIQVDHVIPVRLSPEKKYEKGNLQSLCRSCHGIKGVHERRGIAYDYGRDLAYRLR